MRPTKDNHTNHVLAVSPAGPLSAADGCHWAVCTASQLKHAGVRCALAPHCRANDQPQLIITGATSHGIPQADLARPKRTTTTSFCIIIIRC
jgi:hypothetical protein